MADISELHAAGDQTVGSRNRPRSSSIQRGVMRAGSQAREYDLIPGIVDCIFYYDYISFYYIVLQKYPTSSFRIKLLALSL